ncbi:MAG: hypothetical protein H6550_16260 [Chitinophagales bacterium]|nr:hypothetical protein [Chitinophagales bacterium]
MAKNFKISGKKMTIYTINHSDTASSGVTSKPVDAYRVTVDIIPSVKLAIHKNDDGKWTLTELTGGAQAYYKTEHKRDCLIMGLISLIESRGVDWYLNVIKEFNARNKNHIDRLAIAELNGVN